MGDRKAPYSVHVYSNGKIANALFETDEQHVFCMNLIAICAHTCGVRVLCPEVMDTHFHVIVKGAPAACEKYRKLLQQLLERWISMSGRRLVAPDGIEVSCDPISTINDLRNKFMYVYRNAITAGFARMPWIYRWGPGNIFFSRAVGRSPYRRLGDMPLSKIRKALHTRETLPPDWLCDDSFMLMPVSYVDVEYVESLFGNPKVFIAYMSQRKDIESDIDGEVSRLKLDGFGEKELRREAKELAGSMFNRRTVMDASFDERFEIARKLWAGNRTYSVSMLARVTYLDKSMLASVFKSK